MIDHDEEFTADIRPQNGEAPASPIEVPRRTRTAPRLAVDIIPDLIAEAGLPVVTTGYRRVDELLGGGMAARCMTLLTGPTGCGKTAWAAQLAARHAATAPVLVYSGELTPAQLVARIIAQRTGRSWRQVLRLDVDEPTMREILTPLRLYVLGRSDSPVDDIVDAATDLARRGDGLPLIVIDYAQLVADVSENMRLSVMSAVRTLHRLTETADITMLLLAQGSRASSRAMREADGAAETYVDAGAETAQLEQAAANVIALLGSRPDGAAEWDVTAAVAKSRYGVTGRAGLHIAGAPGRWTELDGLPVTELDTGRDAEIVAIVSTHAPDCQRCAGRPLSANALSDRKRHPVSGRKQSVLESVRRLETAGLIRQESGVLLPGTRA